ncbi:MAG: hypothetical protein ACTSPE_05695 [Candidatus Thorarchaeota archaeon]
MDRIEVLNRVCWNEFGWVRPSGSCLDEEGFPKTCGFGHEEWNLNTEDAVEGYVYGYVEKTPSVIKSGDRFILGFWAREPKTKEPLLVGVYLEAELSGLGDDVNLTGLVHSVFKSRGIYGRRADELVQVQGVPEDSMCLETPREPSDDRHAPYTWEEAYEIVVNSVQKGYLRVRCPVDKVLRLDPPIPLPRSIGGKTIHHRFKTPLILGDEGHLLELFEKRGVATGGGTDRQDQTKDTNAPSSGIGAKPKHPPAGKTGYHIIQKYPRITAARAREIIPKHNELVNGFIRWLQKKGISSIIEREWIDLIFSYGRKSFMVEAKIVGGVSPRKAIREALGQVIEYNLYPGRNSRDVWVILIDTEPSPEDRDFIRTLKEKYGLPLDLAWPSEDDFSILEGSIVVTHP